MSDYDEYQEHIDDMFIDAIMNKRHREVSELFFHAQIDLDTIDSGFRIAVKKKYKRIISILVTDPNIIPDMSDAVQTKDIEIVKMVLTLPNANPMAGLLDAMAQNRIDIMELLVNDPRSNPSDAMFLAIERNNPDLVEFLIQDHRVNPAKEKNRAIRLAAERGNLTIVALLARNELVKAAGLPAPNPNSENVLARVLGELAIYNAEARQSLGSKLRTSNKTLADYELVSHVMKYHDWNLREK